MSCPKIQCSQKMVFRALGVKSIVTHSPQTKLGEWGGMALLLLGSIWPKRHPSHPCPKNMGKKVNHSLTKKNKILTF